MSKRVYAEYSQGATRLLWQRWKELQNQRNKQRKHKRILQSYCQIKSLQKKNTTSKPVQLLQQEKWPRRSRRHSFYMDKPSALFILEGVYFLTFFSTKHSLLLNKKSLTANLLKEDQFKLSWKIYNLEESRCWS